MLDQEVMSLKPSPPTQASPVVVAPPPQPSSSPQPSTSPQAEDKETSAAEDSPYNQPGATI